MVNFSDVNYLPWLVPVGPLLAFLIISLATNRAKLTPSTNLVYGGFHPPYRGMEVPVATTWSRILSITVGISGVVMALMVSWTLVSRGLATHEFGVGDAVFTSGVEWLATGTTV